MRIRSSVSSVGGDAQQVKWVDVGRLLQRSARSCRKRWHNSIKEGTRQGQFTPQDDAKILAGVHAAVDDDGVDWDALGKSMGRTGQHVRTRYHNSLKKGLKKGVFSKEDDAAIRTAVASAGGGERVVWGNVGLILGRTGRSVSQRYYSHAFGLY